MPHFVQYRVMPGQMFTGRWRVEAREVYESPRYGRDDATPWCCVSLHETREEAEAEAVKRRAEAWNLSQTPLRVAQGCDTGAAPLPEASMRELDILILDALAHFGDASAGQVAAWIAAPTDDVTVALDRLHTRGYVTILPISGTWTRA